MNKIVASFAIIVSMSTIGYAYAQSDTSDNSTDMPRKEMRGDKDFKRGPIDLQTFSKIDRLKAADTDGDGTLSQKEIEDMVMKRMVERRAKRMERRLDVNGDGKVTIAEIEKQRQKEFAALDRNDDGKLERSELRMARGFGHHGKHGRHNWHGDHGKRHHGKMNNQ